MEDELNKARKKPANQRCSSELRRPRRRETQTADGPTDATVMSCGRAPPRRVICSVRRSSTREVTKLSERAAEARSAGLSEPLARLADARETRTDTLHLRSICCGFSSFGVCFTPLLLTWNCNTASSKRKKMKRRTYSRS